MYKFTITRYGQTAAAIEIPRKTQAGAERFAWRFCQKHGQDRDQIRIYKQRGRKALTTLDFRINKYWTYKLGANGMKQEVIFGKLTGRIIRA